MERLVSAFINSMRALNRLLRAEKAFQQEAAIFVLGLPLAWFVAKSWQWYAVLVGVVVMVMIVEILNTGIEAACDALSRDFNLEIQFAKDCGSLAVLLSIVIALCVWGLAFVERFWSAAS